MHQQLLGIDSPHKSNPTFEFLSKSFRIHISGQRLQGMQTIHTRINQSINHLVDRSARVQNDLIAMLMRLSCELSKPGENEFIELLGADDQIELGAEIVAEKICIHRIAGGGEKALVGFIIKTTDLIGYRMHHLGILIHLDEIVFHAEQIHDVVVKRRPKAAGAIDVTRIF